MSETETNREIAQLRKIVAELQEKASRSELAEQKMRDTRNKLDLQIEKFTRIHKYAQDAFSAGNTEELYTLIAEGIVDIFQLEMGAVFDVDIGGDAIILKGSCNLSVDAERIALPQGWAAQHDLWNFYHSKAVYESPVKSPPWSGMDLAHVVFTPIFNNEKHLHSIMMGAISEEQKLFYDFPTREIVSPFMVYCQHMNGIINNMTSLEKAKQGEQVKSVFLANLSHEIRTPMNAIIGMTQLAKRSENPEEIKKCITQIDVSSKHLLGLLNDVLDISKIDDGKLYLTQEPFHLRETVEMLYNSVAQNAKDKNQNLSVVFHDAKTFHIRGDAIRLSQVLLNLLTNAIKFTPAGGSISLDIREINREKDRVFIKFSVTDTGIGISQEAVRRIFTPFEQGDNSISRKYGGTGLGLAISQRIVEIMGGKILVDSTVNRGSSFSFFLWFDIDVRQESGQPESPARETETQMPDLTGKNVLVVDDIDINREIVIALLEDTGARFYQAEQGKQAVEMISESETGFYDLVLMDVQMPEMDGYTATRTIRKLERADAEKIKIIAMTANVLKEDVQEAVASGMNGYIGKPVEYETALAMIQQVLSEKN